MSAACLLLLMATSAHGLGAALEPVLEQPVGLPSYQLAVHFDIDPAHGLGTARGVMTLRGWRDLPGTRLRCLYLPYNDDDYEFDPIREFDLVPRKYSKPERSRGFVSLRVNTANVTTEFLSPHVVLVKGDLPPSGLEVAFASKLPRWPDADGDEWLFSDFHPQPLAACPSDPNDSRTFTFEANADISAKLSYGGSWQVASPGLGVEAISSSPAHAQADGPMSLHLIGRKLVVALVRGFTRTTFPLHGVTVELLSRDPELAASLPSFRTALSVATDMYGQLPFPHLVLLETSDLEKSSLPGLVTINRPRQVGATTLQTDILNWTVWQITSFIAEQWFGASVTIRNLDDLWLLRGFVDFTTIEALTTTPEYYPLLRPGPGESLPPDQSFTYLGAQDFMAAVLTYLHPYNALTDQYGISLEPFSKQHSLSHIRHALALRQINWSLGRKQMRGILQRFFARFQGRHVTPQQFDAFYRSEVEHLNIRGGAAAAGSHLQQWWTTSKWPDFELLHVSDEVLADDRLHLITVTLAQNNGYSLPVSVTVTDDAGHTYSEPASPLPGDPRLWQARIQTSASSSRVEIDQSHQILDWDRFNNTDAWPRANFFPGHAKTFADDAYTVLWLPLATKLPGEPLTYELVGQGFRYLHSSLTGLLTYATDQKKPGYSLYYLTDFPKLASYLVVDALQDKGLTFRNERVIEGGLYKTLGWIKDPYLEYGLRLRNREVLGHPKSRHQTLAFRSLVQPLNQYGPCNYAGRLEYEKTVHYIVPNYNYDRRLVEADGSCKVAEYIELGGRAFYGDLLRTGGYKGGNFRFDPQDVNEARLRFDDPKLGRTDQIWTAGADVLVPAYLPVPDDLYLLKRQARYRLFYDFGESEGPHRYYKDAGVGLWLPIGIDLVGKGAVSPLNFSLLVVLYREAGNFKSHTPGILFDFDFIGKI